MSQSPIPTIHLDGTTLEGGGQLLRLALSLSSLTQIPIHVTNIRGNRASRGQCGGMKGSHLAAAEWLARATGAYSEGMKLKSGGLLFRPSTTAWPSSSQSVWREVRKNGEIVRLDTEVKLSTPGSVSLILQALLPYLLLSSPIPASTTTSSPPRNLPANPNPNPTTPVPLRLTLTGGTNVSSSPSYEYTAQILFPTLSRFLSIPPIKAKLHQRGWSSGNPEFGRVTFDITPLSPGSTLPAFNFPSSERGEIVELRASILAPTRDAISALQNLLKTTLLASPSLKDIPLAFPVLETSGHSKRLYLLLCAETSSGHLLGRDCLYDSRRAKRYDTQPILTEVAETVVKKLEAEVNRVGYVDEYMSDQLVVFQALAEGRSCVGVHGGAGATLHARTASWVVERVLGTGFDQEGGCEGVGLRVGERVCDRSGAVDGKEGDEEGVLVEAEEEREGKESEKARGDEGLIEKGMEKLDLG